MMTINLTIVVEVAFFLFFLVLVNRTILRPLLRTMDGRADRVARLRDESAEARAEADRLHEQYITRLTEANQAAAQRLHESRLTTYRENRTCMDDMRAKAEADVAKHRVALNETLEAQRAHFQTLVPQLVEEMDRQVRRGGRLL